MHCMIPYDQKLSTDKRKHFRNRLLKGRVGCLEGIRQIPNHADFSVVGIGQPQEEECALAVKQARICRQSYIRYWLTKAYQLLALGRPVKEYGLGRGFNVNLTL